MTSGEQSVAKHEIELFPGQKLRIGRSLLIVTKVEDGMAYIGIEAPRNVPVMRKELGPRRKK